MIFMNSRFNDSHINMLYVVFIISLLPVINGNLCSVCKCGFAIYEKENLYLVNCTYTSINSTTISLLENLPNHTEAFVFKGHRIPVLPINIFGTEKNLTKLKYIDMTDNKIEEIKGKTFHHVPMVRRLILNHNSITLTNNAHPRVFSNFESLEELHLTDAFLDYNSGDLAEELHSIFINSNLTKLVKLHLEQNEIETFADRRVFCDLKSLLHLHLGTNIIKSLNFNLKCLPNLRYLDLESNMISRFTHEDLSTFDWLIDNEHEFALDIHRNPFICDCNVNPLFLWLKKTKVNVRDKDLLKCHYLNNSTTEIFMKDLSFSDCNNTEHSKRYDGVHPYTKYLLFSLVFLLAAYLVFLSVKYTYVYCRHSITPPGKVHYVVIRNQDDNKEVHVQLNKIFLNV